MTKSAKIALTAILLFLHLSLRPILVSFQGVTYLYFKNPDVADQAAAVLGNLQPPEE